MQTLIDAMNRFHELLNETIEIIILKDEERPLSLCLRIGEEEAGEIIFDDAFLSAELRSFGKTFSVTRDRGSGKATVREGEREIALSSGQGLGGMVILTADSNILVLRGEGFWSISASLIEHETGCRFLRFCPDGAGDRSSVRVEVSPILTDSDSLQGLLLLSIFLLVTAGTGCERS